jgi:hypothetical protein
MPPPSAFDDDPFAGMSDASAEAGSGGEPDWDDPSALGIEQLPSGPIVPGEGGATDAAIDDEAIESIFNDD